MTGKRGGIKIKIEIEIPDDEYGSFFKYLETYFNVKKKAYCEFIIKTEIESRMKDLGFNSSNKERPI